MKRWLLASFTVLATLTLALGIVRWLAPGLLGLPIDLQMVGVSRVVPPFFDNVFRAEDYDSGEFIIPDPFIKRARPLYPDLGPRGGPHDILGFRNRAVPNSPEILTLGDSQTYGVNVSHTANWPSQLGQFLGLNDDVYNMSVGGWGAVEYLELLAKALYLKPRIVIVAFYTGNDPLESFRQAYSLARWQDLRPDRRLSTSDLPRVAFPPPESEWWQVQFPNGIAATFTPRLRLASNRDQPAVVAGYEIMAEAAHRLTQTASKAGIKVVLAIIPTKELVYAEEVTKAGLEAPAEYRSLVTNELANIRALAIKIRAVPESRYVDLVTPLQAAAASGASLYPKSLNGHPLEEGYRVIGQAIAGEVVELRRELTRHDALFRQAFGWQSAGQPEEAIRLYEELLTLDPSHDQAAFNLAYELIRQESPHGLARALELLEPLVERRPDYSEVLFRVAEAYRLLGEDGRAKEWYRRFLAVGGDPGLAETARGHLN